MEGKEKHYFHKSKGDSQEKPDQCNLPLALPEKLRLLRQRIEKTNEGKPTKGTENTHKQKKIINTCTYITVVATLVGPLACSCTDDIVTSPAKRLLKGDIVVVTTRVRELMRIALIRPETIRHNDIIVDTTTIQG
jgi:hypothetical protein